MGGLTRFCYKNNIFGDIGMNTFNLLTKTIAECTRHEILEMD